MSDALPNAPWATPQTPAPDAPWLSSKPVIADSTWSSIVAGLQSSSSGLVLRGRAPSVEENPNAPFYQRIAGEAASLAGDAPAIVAGAAGGAAAGEAIDPFGGGLVGAGAGAFAAPMALRRGLMTAYQQKDGPRSWEQIWDIAKNSLIGGVQGALEGGVVTTGIGAGEAGIAAVGLSGAAKAVAEAGVQTTALASAGAAVQGRLPTAQDFEDSALLIGGVHAVPGVTAKLQDIYAQTGRTPDQVLADTKINPAIGESIRTSDDLPDAYKPLADHEAVKAAVPDPQPGQSATPIAKLPGDADPAQATLPPSPINTDFLETPEHFEAAAKRLSDQIEEQRRGTVSNAQSIEEATQRIQNTLGVGAVQEDGSLAGREPGTPTIASDLLARAMLADDARSRLQSKATALAAAKDSGTETPEMVSDYLASEQRAGRLYSYFMGSRAESGRVLQAAKLTQGTLARGEAMRQAIEENGGDENIIERARRMASLDNTPAVLNAARKASELSTLGKIAAGANEIWKAGLLSGPHTFQVKAIGDAVNGIFAPIERGVASVLGYLHGGDKVTPAEALAIPVGAIRGAREALRVAGATFKETDTGPFEHQKVLTGVAGKVVNIPFKIMSTETAFFRVLNERGELAAQAVRQAVKDGYEPGTNEFNGRVATLTANPTPEMSAAATKAGEDGTYTAELGKTGKAFQNFARTPLGKWVLPFTKVPANLVKWAARRMPGVAFLLDDVRDDFAAGGAARDIAMARQIVGGAVAYTFYNQFIAGNVTGGFEFMTPDQRRTAVAAGKQPYSIKIGNTWYSYARIDPIARVASLAVDLADMIQTATDPEAKQNLPAMMTALFGHALISQTYLSGIDGVLRALDEPNSAAKWYDGLAGSMVPAVLAQTAGMTDPNKRRVDSALDSIKSRIPGLRETLLPQINQLTGEPLQNTENFAVINSSTESTDQVLTEADRLGVGLAPEPKNVHVGKGTGKIGNVPITPEQQNAFGVAEGTLAHQILTNVVTSPGYVSLPDAVKSQIFQRAIKTARQNAAMTALPPEAREIAARQIADEIAAQYALTK